MAHTNIHDPLHVYSNRELPLTQLPVDNNIDTLQRPPAQQTGALPTELTGRRFTDLDQFTDLDHQS